MRCKVGHGPCRSRGRDRRKDAAKMLFEVSFFCGRAHLPVSPADGTAEGLCFKHRCQRRDRDTIGASDVGRPHFRPTDHAILVVVTSVGSKARLTTPSTADRHLVMTTTRALDRTRLDLKRHRTYVRYGNVATSACEAFSAPSISKIGKSPSLLMTDSFQICRERESNSRHQVFQTCALPTELSRRDRCKFGGSHCDPLNGLRHASMMETCWTNSHEPNERTSRFSA
jgi:hypothetical protein